MKFRPVNMSTHEMLSEFTPSLGYAEFEFIVYIPGNSYGMPPIGVRRIPVSDVPGLDFWALKDGEVERHCQDYEEDDFVTANTKRIACVGLSSRVHMSGTYRQLPQIDFKPCVSSESEENVKSILSRQRLPGYLLMSGKSYHFQGTTPMDYSRWLSYMRSIEQHEIVDADWVWECLDDRRSILRLIDAERKPFEPRVISKVDL